MEQFAILIFLIFFTLSLLLLFPKQHRERKKLPPGPRRLPIIGNLHQIGPKPHRSFLRLALEHGPLMLLRLGRIPTLVISSGESLQSIFPSHDRTFSGRPALKAGRKLFFGNSNVTFAPPGESWRQARRLCVHELLSPGRVRSLRSVREEETAALLDHIGERSSSDSPLIDLSEAVFGLSWNVLCRAVFGGACGGGRGGFRGVMAETQGLVAGFCAADVFPGWGWIDGVVGYWGRVERNFRELDRFYETVIEEHLGGGREKERDGEEDLLDALLRLHEEAPDGGFLGTMDHVKGIMAGNVSIIREIIASREYYFLHIKK